LDFFSRIFALLSRFACHSAQQLKQPGHDEQQKKKQIFEMDREHWSE
jgi:hypothetical protein